MNNIYCVRADFGRYTNEFINNGYVGIGWLWHNDLSNITTKEALYPLYKNDYPNDTSNIVIGQQVGQIARFMFDIQSGDFVITPSADTNYLYYGIVEENSYFFASEQETIVCPYRHRKRIKWFKNPILRSEFSVPFQNTMRSSLTVFQVNHKRNFFEVIGRNDLVPKVEKNIEEDYYKLILKRILQLDAKEFEILVTKILEALGFEAEHTGQVSDGGVDATGTLDVSGLAKIKIFVQVKRYEDRKIDANTVKNLRSNIPQGGQGAFITTSDFQRKAYEIATQDGFPRIGLINGNQLVDILTEHWNEIDMPEDFVEKLGLKMGLILL